MNTIKSLLAAVDFSRSVVEAMLLGSVTRHVLSDSKCDVLVVHEEERFATAGAAHATLRSD